MAPLSEHQQLESAWRSLRSNDTSEGWRTIAIGKGRFRAGIRYPENEEVLLAGFSIRPPGQSDLPQARGFSVSRVGDDAAGDALVWIGIARTPAASMEMFTIMAADLLESDASIGDVSELRAYHSFVSRIRSWQQFMERPRDRKLSESEEIGLFGELKVVQRLIRSGRPASEVLRMWKGPANGLRDFSLGTVDLEVKSTISPNGFPARIASLEQLDDADDRTIYLLAQRFALDASGQSLPELIEEVRQDLGEGDELSFGRSLLMVGYEGAFADEYVRRFIDADVRAYRMDEHFPRLARSAVPLAIKSAKYDLDLDLVGDPTAELDEIYLALGGPLPL
jgi:hypothetical protein